MKRKNIPVFGGRPSRYMSPFLREGAVWTSSVVKRLPDGVRKSNVSPSFITSNRGMSFCWDASGFSCLTFSQSQKYKTSWATFARIQAFDSNVSTLNSTSGANLRYYTFSNYQEKNQFIEGQYLHLKSLPYYSTLWITVNKS